MLKICGGTMTKEYIEVNNKITENLLNTQSQSEREKIKIKRHIPIVKIISKYANKDLPLLDIGAREGNLLKLLSENGFKNLSGADISTEAIKLLKEKGFIGYIIDAQNFNLKKSFYTIILSHVLEHCPDAKKVIDNIHSHLVAGGILYVEVPRQPKIQMPTKAGHFHHYDELVEFLELFPLSRWRLLHCDYTRGDNKGRIKTVFKKVSK
jgi:2-polyprenyl-3-methyl-5-hydroxy-6-metoxy-1,4-benzoquinol methylase